MMVKADLSVNLTFDTHVAFFLHIHAISQLHVITSTTFLHQVREPLLLTERTWNSSTCQKAKGRERDLLEEQTGYRRYLLALLIHDIRHTKVFIFFPTQLPSANFLTS